MSSFPTNSALEAAIVANAEEDTPRLAYADWLDEHGDADRAEFIRVQCQLAELPPAIPTGSISRNARTNWWRVSNLDSWSLYLV